jgi:hypothetical protein
MNEQLMIDEVHCALIVATLKKLNMEQAVKLVRDEFAHGHMLALIGNKEFMDWITHNQKEIENACK